MHNSIVCLQESAVYVLNPAYANCVCNLVCLQNYLIKKIGESELGMERELSYKSLNEFSGNTKGKLL